MSTQFLFSWDASAPEGAAGSMTLERSAAGVWSIVDDPNEPDGAVHATISSTAVANKISIGYVDFGAWVNGWDFDNTYTSGTYSGTIGGSWSSSFVSLVEQSSGPTVTSIDSSTVHVPSPDTIAVTDFTLTKDAVAYTATTSNLNLTGPTVYQGSRFYDYSLSLNGSGWYTRTVGGQSYTEFNYDNSWESNTSGIETARGLNNSTLLNLVGAIPSTTVIDFNTTAAVIANWSLEMRTQRHLLYRETLSGSGNSNIFGVYIQGDSTDVKAYLYYRQERSYQVTNAHTESFSLGSQETMTLQTSSAGNTFTVSVDDWVFYTEYGDGYFGPPPLHVFYSGGGGGRKGNFW